MGHNILLVTDDRESKELLMLHLNSNGFTVDIAENEEMLLSVSGIRRRI